MKIKLNYDSDLQTLDPVATPVLHGCFGKYIGKKRLAAGGGEPARYSQGEFAMALFRLDGTEPNIAAEWLAILLCVQEDQSSNLVLRTGSPDSGFLCFSPVFLGKCQDGIQS